MTAVGTVAVAVVAVVVALFGEQRASARLHKERTLDRAREQLAEAYRVQIILRKRAAGSGRRLVAYVLNHGGQTITEVDARFTPDGQFCEKPFERERVRAQRDPMPQIVARMSEKSVEVASLADRLTPFDAGLQFRSGVFNGDELTKPGVIVRWTDRWSTRWENRNGEVKQVDKDDDWKP